MVFKMRVPLVTLENLASRKETPSVGEKPRHQRGGLRWRNWKLINVKVVKKFAVIGILSLCPTIKKLLS